MPCSQGGQENRNSHGRTCVQSCVNLPGGIKIALLAFMNCNPLIFTVCLYYDNHYISLVCEYQYHHHHRRRRRHHRHHHHLHHLHHHHHHRHHHHHHQHHHHQHHRHHHYHHPFNFFHWESFTEEDMLMQMQTSSQDVSMSSWNIGVNYFDWSTISIKIVFHWMRWGGTYFWVFYAVNVT